MFIMYWAIGMTVLIGGAYLALPKYPTTRVLLVPIALIWLLVYVIASDRTGPMDTEQLKPKPSAGVKLCDVVSQSGTKAWVKCQ